jgi:transposase-like protein
MRLIKLVWRFGITEILYHQPTALEFTSISRLQLRLDSKGMKCPQCKSTQVNRNGHHHGKQNYLCKQCGRQFVEFQKARGYSNDVKKICLRIYASGVGFREIERLTGINHNTILHWARQAEDVSLQRAEPEDAESSADLDELDTG